MVARTPTIVHNGTTDIRPTFQDPVTTYLVPGIKYPQAYHTTTDTVDASVIGQGLYNVYNGAVLEFLHSVGPGQKVELNGNASPVELSIHDPAHFYGHVDMNYLEPSGVFRKSPPGTEQIEVAMQMAGRSAVDSYSYKHDMLSLWLGNKVVQTLSLTVNDPYGFTVQQAPGSWVFVSANDRSSHGVSFLNIPADKWAAMPLHQQF